MKLEQKREGQSYSREPTGVALTRGDTFNSNVLSEPIWSDGNHFAKELRQQFGPENLNQNPQHCKAYVFFCI